MKAVRIAAACAALAVIVGTWTTVIAGTLPNISGRWYANGLASKPCSLNQSGTSVTLRNEQGINATGSFTDPSTLSTNWGPFTITGHISSDLNTITWSNGTYWTRTPTSGPTPRPTPTATPGPHGLPLEQTNYPGAAPPIRVFGAWAAQTYDRTAGFLCFSFENKANVAATVVRFEFDLLDKHGQAMQLLHLDRKGTFSPNIEIHGSHNVSEYEALGGPRGYRDNCVSWRAQNGSERKAYARARSAVYRIDRIDFTDGTQWPAAPQ